MKQWDLLSILGNVKSEYILQAQQLRSGDTRNHIQRIHKRRLLLIAAIISLLVLLVGCTVYVWRMQDLVFGTTSVWGQPAYRLSFQGFTDSPGYQATKEWFDFLDTYDTDGKLLENAPYDDYVEPEAYVMYSCYTEEMVKKVDELCQKYALSLMGHRYQGEPEELYKAVGIDSIFVPNPVRQYQLWRENLYYADGSFTLWGEILSAQAEQPPEFRFWCMKKESFCDFHITITDIDSYQQWNYTTRNGAQLVLAVGPERSLILADQQDTFLTLYLYCAVSKEELESVAEDFDFTIRPQKTDTEYANSKEQERLAAEEADLEAIRDQNSFATYEEFIPNYINTVDNRYYTLVDIDGNGVEELAYSYGAGYQELMTIVDGKVVLFDTLSYPYGYSIYRAKNGDYVIHSAKSVENQTFFSLWDIQGTDLVYREYLRYDPDAASGSQYYRCSNAKGKTVLELFDEGMNWEPISFEMYNQISTDYGYAPELEMLPISDFFPDGNYESANPFVQDSYDALLKDLQANPDRISSHYYTFQDVTGDGSQELLIGTEDSVSIIMTIRNGDTYVLADFYGAGDAYWCGNSVILWVVEEETNVRHHFYSVTENGLDVFMVLLYDGQKWYTSPEGGNDEFGWYEITEAEYKQNLAQYPTIRLDMKPIAEYDTKGLE